MTPRMNALRARIMAEGCIRYKRVADLAAAAGVGMTSVYRFFNGGEIVLENVLRLARAVGLEVTLAGNEPVAWSPTSPMVVEPVEEAEPVKEVPVAECHAFETPEDLRNAAIVCITRCSRPANLPAVGKSIRDAAAQTGANVAWAVMLDGDHLQPQIALPYAAEADPDAVRWYYRKRKSDRCMAGALNAAVADYCNPDAWCLVVDDDNVLLPAALELIQKHGEGRDLLIWGCDAHGDAVGRIDFANYAFRASLARRIKFDARRAGFEDGAFIADCLAAGVKPKTVHKIAAVYNALRGGKHD